MRLPPGCSQEPARATSPPASTNRAARPAIMTPAARISADTWRRLARAHFLSARLDEETLRDLLVLEMPQFRNSNAFRIYHLTKREESWRGSDILVWIRRNDGLSWFLAIQAKKLYPDGNYKALNHRPPQRCPSDRPAAVLHEGRRCVGGRCGAGGGSTPTFVGLEAYRICPSGPLRAADFDARIDSAPRELFGTDRGAPPIPDVGSRRVGGQTSGEDDGGGRLQPGGVRSTWPRGELRWPSGHRFGVATTL